MVKGTMPLDLPPTSWSLLGAAAGAGPDAALARDAFVRRYYEPVHAYFTALAGGGADRADDLAQSFFASRILDGAVLPRAHRSLGSFRCYLKRAVRNFYLDSLRKDRRLKRGGEAVWLPLDQAGALADPDEHAEPERSFHSAWVRALLRAALERLAEECQAEGQRIHFEIFQGRYVPSQDPTPSWTALGAPYGLDEKAARGRAETVARRFRRVLRELLRIELGSTHAVDEELAVMRALLAGSAP